MGTVPRKPQSAAEFVAGGGAPQTAPPAATSGPETQKKSLIQQWRQLRKEQIEANGRRIKTSVYLPEKVHRDLSLHATLERKSLNDLILAALDPYLAAKPPLAAAMKADK